MFTRAERIGQAGVVAVALVLAVAAGGVLLGAGDESAAGPGAPSASASPKQPRIAIAQGTCCEQAARFFDATWSSSDRVTAAALTVTPDPGFPCRATVDATGLGGRLGCEGLLRGATRYAAALSVTTAAGTFVRDHTFTTMGDRLTGVKWFTEFEDPAGDPLACAAASIRIVQSFTAGTDPLTATRILAEGQRYNRSTDPGLDPVAIATMQKELDAGSNYHYYRLDTREEATRSAVYWLLRTGKPVHVISLAGQHDPVLIGFTGSFGAYYGDPATNITGVVVLDPQRGDMRPETARFRPDKYRTSGFQTGQTIGLEEWYGDEWWLRYAYASSIRMPDGSYRSIERSDGVYATPHWAGTFVILVDDGDGEWPSDREGRVKFR